MTDRATQAIQCINKEACIGGILANDSLREKGECTDNFVGNLCSECKEGFAEYSNYR